MMLQDTAAFNIKITSFMIWYNKTLAFTYFWGTLKPQNHATKPTTALSNPDYHWPACLIHLHIKGTLSIETLEQQLLNSHLFRSVFWPQALRRIRKKNQVKSHAQVRLSSESPEPQYPLKQRKKLASKPENATQWFLFVFFPSHNSLSLKSLGPAWNRQGQFVPSQVAKILLSTLASSWEIYCKLTMQSKNGFHTDC